MLMETQIKYFGMSQMTIGSCSDFHTQVNKFITIATPAALHITALAPGYAEKTTTLASLVNRQRAFISTASLADADVVRDNASGLISNVVTAYLTSTIAEKREAARLLSPQLSVYKGIRNHEYTKQTAEIRGMLGVLDAEGNAAAVATLGLTDEVEALRAANATFETAFVKKTGEMSERMEQQEIKSKDVINDTNKLYQDIVQTVNAYAIVQPSDEIRQFIKNINGLVGTYSKISGNKTSDTPSKDMNEPTPGPVTPAITSIYNVEGRDPEKPLFFWRTDHAGMDFQGFTLKGKDGTLEHVIGLVEENDMFTEWIKPEAITNVTDTSCQFAMVEDLASGKFKVRVETYDGGSPLVVEYPEMITLD